MNTHTPLLLVLLGGWLIGWLVICVQKGNVVFYHILLAGWLIGWLVDWLVIWGGPDYIRLGRLDTASFFITFVGSVGWLVGWLVIWI